MIRFAEVEFEFLMILAVAKNVAWKIIKLLREPNTDLCGFR
jgi:hypothetical protein